MDSLGPYAPPLFKGLKCYKFSSRVINDDLVKSPFPLIFIIPAKAGIQLIQAVLDSCFRRNDGFSSFLRVHHKYQGEKIF